VPGKYESKAVQSNRSQVANITQFLKSPMNTGEFIQFLLDVQLENPVNHAYVLNEADIQAIEKSASEKFRTWEWNFGYSPKYTFKNEVEIEGKLLKIEMWVEKGMIVDARITGDFFANENAEKIAAILKQKSHWFEDLIESKESFVHLNNMTILKSFF
jgi:lipoate-protein ligase A